LNLNSLPLVSIITVNYNGKVYLKNLFESLSLLDYPKDKIQIIMVDNASGDDSVRFTQENFPFVKIIRCRKNTGFAEGNNIGLSHADGELIAIINNDCVAEPGWLLAMVRALFEKEKESADSGNRSCKVGAIGSKIFFYYRYYPLNICFERNNTGSGSGDTHCAEINEIELNIISEIYDKSHESQQQQKNESEITGFLLKRSIRYLSGIVPAGRNSNGEIIYKTERKSLIGIPVPDNNFKISIRIDFSVLPVGERINIKIADKEIISKTIENNREIIAFEINDAGLQAPRYIVNSRGSMINKKFYAKEIGYDEFDSESDTRTQAKIPAARDEKITEVFAIPGTGFLCRKSVLEAAGFFDSKFFTYYEDIDFFWRLKLSGYRSYICADSVLRHLHCGSGTEWSYSFTYHVLRNRMLMIYKCAWFGAFIKNYLSFTASAFIGLAYGIILKIRKISSSRPDIPIRIRILFEFFILFFRKLPERIKIRKNKIISDDEIIKWLNDF
jgi:GT2 family glycosyltransferase